jgi:predicted secreted protein
MAVINANCVAIYYYEGTTSKRPVLDTSGSTYTVGDFVVNGDEFTGIATSTSAVTTTLTLVGAATNSVIEVSNAVENVARDGAGGMLQQTSQTWSVQADGLIQDTNDAGTDLFKIARDKKYVVVKWSVGETGSTEEFIGQALIDTVTLTGSVDEIANYSVSLTGVDDIYYNDTP